MAGVEQHRHLLVPGAAAQRVAVDQDDRLSRPVVLVVKLDVSGVLLSDVDVGRLLAPSDQVAALRGAAISTSATRPRASPATGFNRPATASRSPRDDSAAISTRDRNTPVSARLLSRPARTGHTFCRRILLNGRVTRRLPARPWSTASLLERDEVVTGRGACPRTGRPRGGAAWAPQPVTPACVGLGTRAAMTVLPLRS
jgi:hypothetical protein